MGGGDLAVAKRKQGGKGKKTKKTTCAICEKFSMMNTESNGNWVRGCDRPWYVRCETRTPSKSYADGCVRVLRCQSMKSESNRV